MYKVIFRNGTQPTTIDSGELLVFDSENENVVVLSSGIPNVDLKKIYADIVGGAVYTISKVRIECIFGDSTSTITQPIEYGIRTSNGDCEKNPIYPNLSLIQHVKNVVDIEFDERLLNIDGSIDIQSIPAYTKVRYMFYPKEQVNPSITALHTDTDIDYQVPNLNNIEGDNNVLLDSEQPILEEENIASESNVPVGSAEQAKKLVKEKTGKKCWWWLLLVGAGVFITYKQLKK